jgi:uncharacterized membrane protein HdeD (DUF308 family)
MSNVPPAAPGLTPAVTPELVSRFRLWFLIVGILLVLLGLLAASHPFLATAVIVEIFGAILVVSGLVQAGVAVWSRHGSNFVIDLLGGILGAVIGILIVVKPLIGAEAITLLLAVYFLVGGVFRFVSSFVSTTPARVWMAFAGLVDLILGVMILNRWPSDSTWVLGLFVAVNLLFSGVLWIVLALSLRTPPATQVPAGGQ